MKRFIFTIMILAIASTVMSAPYASRISVDKFQMSQGGNLTINYFINEAGGTATINIIKVSDSSVVATFTGTATKGVNSVVWHGTVDNAGGAQVPAGNYRVKISLSATKPAGWAEIASNSSLGNYVPIANATIYQTLWDGYSGKEWLISKNTELDSFGYLLVSTSYTVPPFFGHVVFNPDLSCYDGGNGQTTWLNFPGTPASATTTAVWGNCFDPDDPNYVWVCGQTGSTNVFYAKWNDATLVDKTGGATAELANARDISVRKEGATKYAYVTNGNSTLYKCTLDASNIVQASPVNIFGLTDTLRYGKGVDFDSNGNLYWTSRYNNSTSGNGGAVYRWDKSQVEAATAGSLTEANATWEVFIPGSNSEGAAITPDGNVYAGCTNEDPANDGSLRGIYLIGNISSATNKKTLTVSDRIYPFYGTDYASAFSALFGISSDCAGNLYVTDTLAEQVRCIGPGGTTNVAVVAPSSQNVEIVAGSLAVKNWAIYE
jgi:hypothetical protein